MNQPRVDNRIEERRAAQVDDEPSDRFEVVGPERVAARPDHIAAQPAIAHSEEVQRIHVEDEDRLAFRVGVNILTLVLIGLAAYLVWRNFFQ